MPKFEKINKMTKKEKGVYAEALAAHIYINKYHHRVIYKNLNLRFGEIDLITTYKGIIYIIEVKSTTNSDFGEAIEKWRHNQRRKLAASVKVLLMRGIIKSFGKVCVDFIVFDFSGRSKVRFKRYTNISLGI